MIALRSEEKNPDKSVSVAKHEKCVLPTPNSNTLKDCHSQSDENNDKFKDCLSEDEGDVISFPLQRQKVIEFAVQRKVLPPNVDNIDENDVDDPQCVTEYVDDMFEYLFNREKYYYEQIRLSTPAEAWNFRIRQILIDWIVDVCFKFKLVSETYLLCVALIDFAIGKPEMANLTRSNIQLFGCTALWIASKIEDHYHPHCRDFVYISDKAFTKQDMLQMELRIMNATKLNLQLPHSLLFLRRFSKAAYSDAKTHTLSKYICESVAVSGEICHQFLPSEIAAGAVYLARISSSGQKWSETLAYYTKYSAVHACKVAVELYKYITAELTYKACKRKYAGTKLLEVSKINLKDPLND